VTLDRTTPGVRLTWLADEKATSGTPLDLGTRLVSFSFEESESKAAQVSLVLDNYDLTLFDREDLASGAVLEVSWGYPALMSTPRRVVLRRLKGFQTLTLDGQATSVLLNRIARTRTFAGLTRSEVVRRVASEQGFEGERLRVEVTSEPLDVVHQAGETDARFLRRLAAREGFDFRVDDTGLHWGPRDQSTPPARVFTWFSDQVAGDVLSGSVESDLTRRVGRVEVRGRDPMRKVTVEAKATGDSTARATLGEVVEVVDPDMGTTSLQTRNAAASVHAAAASTERAAQREADARFRHAERASVKVTLEVVGDPTLRANTIVELRGLSAYLSGRYHVDEAKHSVSGSGYTTTLRLTRDAVGARAKAASPVKPQGGEPNRSAAPPQDRLTEVEVVDPDTGRTRVEYRREGRAIGASDPEGRRAG